jgi:hypothetical protein
MYFIILACVVFFLLSCTLALRIVLSRHRIVVRERKSQAIRENIIFSLSEILAQPPPRILPSSPEYQVYIKRISATIRSLVPNTDRNNAALRDTLLDFLSHLSGEARIRIEQIYAECGYVDDALQRLASPQWWERANAVRELRIARASYALNPLCDMLVDRNPDVVLEALHAVLDTGGVRMIPRVVRILPHISQLEEMYIVNLCMNTGFECMEYIVPMLDDKRNDIKRFAIEALGAVHSFEHVSLIVPFLASSHRELVTAALHALGYIGSDEATSEIEKLCFRADPLIQVEAAVALRRIGGAESMRILTAMLDDKESTVRGAASNALAKLRLKQVFDSGSPSEALAYFKTRSFQSRGAL